MNQDAESKPAVILLSGGLDSATVLAIARQQGFNCHALSVAYGQRHQAELRAAQWFADQYCESFRQISLDMRLIGGSALTDDTMEVPTSPGDNDAIPVTYVPARNTVFLSLAMGLAEVVQANDVFIGVNAVDYSGYPDCRPAFLDQFRVLSRVATKVGVETGQALNIHAPLLDMSKADIVSKGTQMGVDYVRTVSCYQADEHGRACGQCDSCRLRRQGFLEAGIADPTQYQTAMS